MSTKEYHSWLCAQMRTAEQQIEEFPCAAVYKAHNYHSFMVYIQATSPHHVRCSKPLVVLSLLHKH